MHERTNLELLLVEGVGEGENLTGGHVDLDESLLPLHRGVRAHGLLEFRRQEVAVALAQVSREKSLIDDEVAASDHLADRLELRLGIGGDVDEAVAGAKGTRRRRRRVVVAVTRRDATRYQVLRDDPTHRGDRGFEHRDVEVAPDALSFASNERGADSDRGDEAAQRVTDREADAQGVLRGRAGHVRHAGETLDDLVVGRSLSQGPV